MGFIFLTSSEVNVWDFQSLVAVWMDHTGYKLILERKQVQLSRERRVDLNMSWQRRWKTKNVGGLTK